jgi:hypothetical protein
MSRTRRLAAILAADGKGPLSRIRTPGRANRDGCSPPRADLLFEQDEGLKWGMKTSSCR